MAEYYREERRPSKWFWLLLLPLFFISGWWLNDIVGSDQNSSPQVGVGGGPYVEEQNSDVLSPSSKTDTNTFSPTPAMDSLEFRDETQNSVLDVE